ncbi:MAG: RDD family protein [Planctomycetota bacterium]
MRVIAVLSLMAAGAVAQQPNPAAMWVSAGSTDDASGAGHGWLLLPIGPYGDPLLYHLPPRSRSASAALPGTVRLARTLDREPEAMAVAGGTLYLIGPIQGAGEGEPRRWVASVRARPAGVSDLWRYEPLGPPTAQPVLPGLGGLVGVGTDGRALIIVTHGRDEGLHIRRLEDNAWRTLSVPPVQAQPAQSLAFSGGLLLGFGSDSPAWLGTPTEDGDFVWAEREGIVNADWLGVAGDRLIMWDGTSLLAQPGLREGVEPGEAFALSELPEWSSGDVWIPMAGDQRLVLVRAAPDGQSISKLVELSTATGRELYIGEPVQRGPVTASDLRILAVALVIATGSLLLLAVRGPDPTVAALPDGASLAEPGRRVFATCLDIGIGAILAAFVTGRPLSELISPITWFTAGGARDAIVFLSVVFGLGVLGDWLLAGSPGKRLTGCRVVSAQAGPPRRLSLLGSFVRNLVKFGLPVVAAMILLDHSRRHRGDALAGSAVVIFGDRLTPEEN